MRTSPADSSPPPRGWASTLFMFAIAADPRPATQWCSACAFREDRMLVTSNVGDFVRLARAVQVHPGLVLIDKAASCAPSRWRWFEGRSI